MEIDVFKLIYLQNDCTKSKNCKKTYQLPCFLYTKSKNCRGFKCNSRNTFSFLDTVIQTCWILRYLRNATRLIPENITCKEISI